MSQDPYRQTQGEQPTPAEPHVAPAGERIVLNDAREAEDPGFLARATEVLIQVAGAAAGKGRTQVLDELTAAFDAARVDIDPVVVGGFTDTILRGTRSRFTVETDAGQTLATFVGDEAGDNLRVQPQVSDPSDEDRPFYS